MKVSKEFWINKGRIDVEIARYESDSDYAEANDKETMAFVDKFFPLIREFLKPDKLRHYPMPPTEVEQYVSSRPTTAKSYKQIGANGGSEQSERTELAEEYAATESSEPAQRFEEDSNSDDDFDDDCDDYCVRR